MNKLQKIFILFISIVTIFSSCIENNTTEEFYDTGELKKRCIEISGNVNCEEFFKNGNIKAKFSEKNGNIDGKLTAYDKEGRIRQISQYNAGLLNGKTKLLNEKGQISNYGNFQNGQRVGKWNYYINNMLTKEELYRNGELVFFNLYNYDTLDNIIVKLIYDYDSIFCGNIIFNLTTQSLIKDSSNFYQIKTESDTIKKGDVYKATVNFYPHKDKRIFRYWEYTNDSIFVSYDDPIILSNNSLIIEKKATKLGANYIEGVVNQSIEKIVDASYNVTDYEYYFFHTFYVVE